MRQAHVTLRAPDDLVTPAAPALPDTAALTETQPRAQRLRSVANWQALVPLLEGLPAVAGVSPMVSGSGLALRGEASQAIALMGVELDRYDRVAGLRSRSSAAARGWRRARRSSAASWRRTWGCAWATASRCRRAV